MYALNRLGGLALIVLCAAVMLLPHLGFAGDEEDAAANVERLTAELKSKQEELINARRQLVELRWKKAMKLFDEKHYGEAAVASVEVLKANPYTPGAMYDKCRLLRLAAASRAADHLWRAISSTTNPAVRTTLGEECKQMYQIVGEEMRAPRLNVSAEAQQAREAELLVFAEVMRSKNEPLVVAECLARAGNVDNAKKILEQLTADSQEPVRQIEALAALGHLPSEQSQPRSLADIAAKMRAVIPSLPEPAREIWAVWLDGSPSPTASPNRLPGSSDAPPIVTNGQPRNERPPYPGNKLVPADFHMPPGPPNPTGESPTATARPGLK